jgi:hypothetical protein
MDEPLVDYNRHDMALPFVPNFVNNSPSLTLIFGQLGAGKSCLTDIYTQQGAILWQDNKEIKPHENYFLDVDTNISTILETINKFKTFGFKTEAIVLSVPDKVSWLSILETMPDIITKSEHDRQCNIVPEITRKLYDNKTIDLIRIIDLNFNSLFSDQLHNNNWQRNKNPVEVILESRSKPFTLAEIDQYQNRWDKLLKSMEKNSISPEKIFQARVERAYFENELKYLNVASKLTYSQTYKEAFYKNINENIIDKPMSNSVKLKLIGSVYKMAEEKLKQEARDTGDKFKAAQATIKTPHISLSKTTNQKTKSVNKNKS